MAIAFYLLLALIGGAMIPFQAGINAQLAELVNGPIRAALVSFLVGTVVLFVAAAIMPRPLPSMSKLGGAPWWVWLGGILGAFYVAVSVIVAPRLGAAALIWRGRRGSAHRSAPDRPVRPRRLPRAARLPRIAGVVCLFAGVLLIRIF